MTVSKVRRGFVDIPEGQIHYRTAGSGAGVPLVLLHGAPASSYVLAPMVAEYGKTRPTFALDALGMGDSSPPAESDPDTAVYARAVLAALDGLGIARFDLHGMLTGARIAVEIALTQPQRVRKLVVERVSFQTPEERAEWLQNFAPPVVPDDLGTQFNFAWQFVRDEFSWFPWYKRTAQNSLNRTLLDASHLHFKVVEMLKGITTYHLFVRQGLRYPSAERVPMIAVPTLATDEVAKRVPGAVAKKHPPVIDCGMVTADDIRNNVAEIVAFLDA